MKQAAMQSRRRSCHGSSNRFRLKRAVVGLIFDVGRRPSSQCFRRGGRTARRFNHRYICYRMRQIGQRRNKNRYFGDACGDDFGRCLFIGTFSTVDRTLALDFGNLIKIATELHPFFMGILVSVLVGIALTLPISSAAIWRGVHPDRARRRGGSSRLLCANGGLCGHQF